MINANGNQNILVVDDDREWNLLLKIRLEQSGYKVTQAFQGDHAVECIKKQIPDLVLLDITMPQMNGWDVCRVLRADPKTQELPVIILSSYSSENDILQGKIFHIKRYLIKPCLPEAVLEALRAVFSEK